MSDLYRLVTDIVAKHDCYDYAGGLDCRCGESFFGDDNNAEEFWAAHVGQVVGDLLIDLAGTGQLLASIDRIACLRNAVVAEENAQKDLANACRDARRQLEAIDIQLRGGA